MSITHNDPNGAQIVKHSYNDSTNNIVEYLNSIDGQTSYDYDFLGQLISADHANQTDESYIYDSNGNRITANGSNYTTGDNNELTSDGDYTYTYDAEGNRISKSNSTDRELYEWDYRNRLTKVTQQTFKAESQTWETVQIVEYAYDYNNIWIRKVVGENKTIFIPENYQTAVQIDNGTTTHHYLWTPNQQDKLLADTTTDGVLWSLTDHLGTIRDIIGSENAHLIYDAFGNLISGTNPLLFGFTGKAFDTSTQLQNNINRWYDAAVGRWLSTDPIGFEGNDTNLYRYVGNAVAVSVDFRGLKWKIERNGQGTALAIRDNLNEDTIESLALLIGLDASEAEAWLTTTESPCKFEIPNTIFMAWFGELGSVGRCFAKWHENEIGLKALGFHVVIFNNDSFDKDDLQQANLDLHRTMKALAKQKTIHGMYLMGHGSEDAIGSFEPHTCCIGPKHNNILYSMIDMELTYRLGALIIHACQGDNLNSRKLISPNGIFKGVDRIYVPVVLDGKECISEHWGIQNHLFYTEIGGLQGTKTYPIPSPLFGRPTEF